MFGSLVGQSEAGMRQALSILEAQAPAVVLLDEIEKAFGGTGGSSSDGGTTQRVFGTFLSWLNDRDNTIPLIIVATSNNISLLPPELLRKGRFSEIFFVDLPDTTERSEILRIHVRLANERAGKEMYKLTTGEFSDVVLACGGFVGAEIQAAVSEACVLSFGGGGSFHDGMLSAIRETKPLSVVMADRIQALQLFAETRCRRASPRSDAAGTKRGGPPPVAKASNFKLDTQDDGAFEIDWGK